MDDRKRTALDATLDRLASVILGVTWEQAMTELCGGELDGTPEAEVLRDVRAFVVALETIGAPIHVPKGFDPLDWWRHTASKRGEIARDALGLTAEQLIEKSWRDQVPVP